MQLILIEPNELIRDLIALNIKSHLSIDVILRADASETIDLIKILPEIDLIITTQASTSEQTAAQLAQHIIEAQLDIPMIVLGKLPDIEGIETIATAVGELDWEQTVQVSAKILGIDDDVLKNMKRPKFEALPVTYLRNISRTSCDIYIRIKKSADDFQYVKRIHQGDDFSNEVIDNYEAQGLQNFYVPKDQFKTFTTFVSNELCNKLNDPTLDIDKKLDLMASTYDFMAKEIVKIGFNSSTVQLCETLVENIVDTFKQEDKLSNLVVKVLTSKSSYIYQHTHLTTIVSCQILNGLNMKSKSDQEKMAFAALFKDITLIDDEELAKINSFEDLESHKELSEEKWNLVFNHALDSAVLVRGYAKAPLDVDNIIKHHHATTNGRGFSVNPPEDKFDLHSIIFMIAIEFVNELLEIKEHKKQPKPLIEELKLKFTSEQSLKVIQSLAKTIKSTKKD